MGGVKFATLYRSQAGKPEAVEGPEWPGRGTAVVPLPALPQSQPAFSSRYSSVRQTMTQRGNLPEVQKPMRKFCDGTTLSAQRGLGPIRKGFLSGFTLHLPMNTISLAASVLGGLAIPSPSVSK